MIKVIKKLFGKDNARRSTTDCALREREYAEYEAAARNRREAEALKAKTEWEERNELAKRHDACNLGMTHTAFDGAYEEWVTQAYAKGVMCMQAMGNARHTQMQAMGNIGNPYGGLNAMGGIGGIGGVL